MRAFSSVYVAIILLMSISGIVFSDCVAAPNPCQTQEPKNYSEEFCTKDVCCTDPQTGVREPLSRTECANKLVQPWYGKTEPAPTLPVSAVKINQAKTELDKITALRKDIKRLEGEISRASISCKGYGVQSSSCTDYETKNEQLTALEVNTAESYQKLLDVDPNNFWTNWDMAHLRGMQRNYNAFFGYLDKALNGKNFNETLKDQLRRKAAADLGLKELPTVQRNPTVRNIGSEMNGWTRRQTFGTSVSEGMAGDKETWRTKLYSIFNSKAYNTIRDLVGLPTETE